MKLCAFASSFSPFLLVVVYDAERKKGERERERDVQRETEREVERERERVMEQLS